MVTQLDLNIMPLSEPGQQVEAKGRRAVNLSARHVFVPAETGLGSSLSDADRFLKPPPSWRGHMSENRFKYYTTDTIQHYFNCQYLLNVSP
jgi:hypothetical protein